jgi:hypothetical protein
LAFTAPVPEAPRSSGIGVFVFDIFGALRPPAAPSGLFVVDLNTSGGATQPRRIGSLTDLAAPVWRDESTIYGFIRQSDGSLSLQSVDVANGTMRDTGAHIPPGIVQGGGLAARWDVERGRALLLIRANAGASSASVAGLQAWLVSFLSPSGARP